MMLKKAVYALIHDSIMLKIVVQVPVAGKFRIAISCQYEIAFAGL